VNKDFHYISLYIIHVYVCNIFKNNIT